MESTDGVKEELPIPVIVLNWNGLDVTIPCIRSLLGQSYPNVEIHVADNGSTDVEKEKLKNYLADTPNTFFYSLEQNLGFAEGCNRILTRLMVNRKYRYFALLNNDAEASKNWVTALVETAQRRNLDMVSSKQLFYNNHDLIDNVGLTLLTTSEILPVGAREPAHRYNSFQLNLCPSAGAGLYSRAVFETVGLFNPYFKTCYEDAEIGLRAALAGMKSGFAPGAVAYHRVNYSVNRIKTDRYGSTLQKNMLYAYFLHMPFAVILLLLPLVVLKTVGLIVLGLITFRKALVVSQVRGTAEFCKGLRGIFKERQNNTNGLNFVKALKLHHSFLRFYFKYLGQFILGRKKTVLE